MDSDPLAISVKKGEKFFFDTFGAPLEGEQSKTVFILFTWLMFMVIVLWFG